MFRLVSLVVFLVVWCCVLLKYVGMVMMVLMSLLLSVFLVCWCSVVRIFVDIFIGLFMLVMVFNCIMLGVLIKLYGVFLMWVIFFRFCFMKCLIEMMVFFGLCMVLV